MQVSVHAKKNLLNKTEDMSGFELTETLELLGADPVPRCAYEKAPEPPKVKSFFFGLHLGGSFPFFGDPKLILYGIILWVTFLTAFWMHLERF